jgi:hypothetical protein
LLLILLDSNLREQPLEQIHCFISFDDLLNARLVRILPNSLVLGRLLGLLAFQSLFVDDILEHENVTTLELLVFDHASREEHIEARILSLLQILIECVSLG